MCFQKNHLFGKIKVP